MQENAVDDFNLRTPLKYGNSFPLASGLTRVVFTSHISVSDRLMWECEKQKAQCSCSNMLINLMFSSSLNDLDEDSPLCSRDELKMNISPCLDRMISP